MEWLRKNKRNNSAVPERSPTREIVYGCVGTQLLGTEASGVRPFVRAVRTASGRAQEIAIERGRLQAAILRQERVLVDRPRSEADRDYYRQLEQLWAELLPSVSNRGTHFIECGVVRALGNNKRQVYQYRSLGESVFFQGAFTIPDRPGWVRDRNCVLICDHLLSQIENDWESYASAALVPTYVWIMMSVMSCWRQLRSV